ncbi:MAG: PIN domain-containing protein, partial [Pseudomonadota bacterium]
MKIFLDANVLFSASNAQSNIYQFLQLLLRDHQLITSPYAFEEARRNIELKRPAWLPTLEALKSQIILCANTPLLVEIALVDKDRPILGAAIGAQCDYLLTGD